MSIARRKTYADFMPLPEFDIFYRPKVQESIDHDFVAEYRPASALDSKSFIEFNIHTAVDEYLRLYKTEFYLRLKITIENPLKVEVKEDDWKNVSVCNNLLNSMFKQVEFWIGDRLIDPPHQTYPYKTYLEKQLGKSEEVKKTSAALGFWIENHQSVENLITEFQSNIKCDDSSKPAEGREFELIGKIHLPMFEQRRTNLLGGCKLKLKFIPNDPSFYIKCISAVRLKSVEFTDCSLRVKGAKVFRNIVEGHAIGLLESNARYMLLENFVVPVTINKGTQDIIIDNLHNGQVPNRAFVTFVDHRSFNGSHTLNPYNFQNFGVNYLSISVNGSPAGGTAKTPNFKKEWYGHEYYDLFEVTNQDNMDTCITISKSQFSNGNNIFAFRILPDLTSGGAKSVGFYNPIKRGSLRLHLKFANALAQTITTLVYLDFDTILEINAERNAIYDFN